MAQRFMPVGLDIGTGTVKTATPSGTFSFPSVIARGRNMDIDGRDGRSVLVGEEAARQEHVRTMVLRTPVYRGAPTSMDDYVELIRHALDRIVSPGRDAAGWHPSGHADLCIVAGIPYNARDRIHAVKKAVRERFSPHFFGMMFQAKATLDNEGVSDGIVCHIGHGTTEIMAVVSGNIAYGQTVMHGVGDITGAISGSKVGYTDHSLLSSGSAELAEYRRILAANIADSLEKVAIDHRGLPVVFAGGGALVPKLVQEIRGKSITDARTAANPVYSNALGMLRKARSRCA